MPREEIRDVSIILHSILKVQVTSFYCKSIVLLGILSRLENCLFPGGCNTPCKQVETGLGKLPSCIAKNWNSAFTGNEL